jgi:hypothetical protein
MQFNPLPLIADDYVDTEVINDLINNDKYLKEAMPNMGFISQAGVGYQTENGNRIRIMSGVLDTGKIVGSGLRDLNFKVPILYGPPCLLLTPYLGSSPGYAQIVKWLGNYSGAQIKMGYNNGTSSAPQTRLCWTLIYVVS